MLAEWGLGTGLERDREKGGIKEQRRAQDLHELKYEARKTGQ